MKTNVKEKWTEKTHEGAAAARTNAEQQLRRSVMACMLWEDTFYEEGESIADRIKNAIGAVSPSAVADVAVEARTKQKLRHVPLLIAREMARLPLHKGQLKNLLPKIIQRADELAEFLSIYWKDGKCPLSGQVKKGLAAAFHNFNEYGFAKYNPDGKVKTRDVLFLCHAKPKGEQADGEPSSVQRKYSKDGPAKELKRHNDSLFGKIVLGKLQTPDTWEVALSGGADKKETFERLMREDKLFALAFLRNLRNMKDAGVSESMVSDYAAKIKLDRVLPFRFIAAARAVPAWEPIIEPMMLRSLAEQEKIPGKTAIVVDNSGSMTGAKVSAKSDMDRSDAACALAVLIREITENCVVIGFGNEAIVIPPRRGFALVDAIKRGPGGGTNTANALALANREGYDRIVVITDEQSHQVVGPPKGIGYFINVSINQNGIGYGPWTHIDGWSESVVDYIRASESSTDAQSA